MILTIEQIQRDAAVYFKDKPVKEVYLFGSYATGQALEKSDVDILFELKEDTRISYFGLAKYLIDLEKILNKKVDLVEKKFVFPRLNESIDKEKILLYRL